MQTFDHALDVLVDADFSWRFKDEDELAAYVDGGIMDDERARAIYEEAQRVINKIDRREKPFCDPWPAWRPDPGWSLPELPAEWDRL